MKYILALFLITALSCHSVGQGKIESFPPLSNFIDAEFSQVDNILPIAKVRFDIGGKSYFIPISYTMFHYAVDSSSFLIHGDFIDNYSFRILDNGKIKPMFKKEALLLPSDDLVFLAKSKQKIDSIKSKIDLSNYIKFLPRPDWWQSDRTPLSEDGVPMKFVCQLELIDFVQDDCCLYIFFDPKRNLVKQIYQRD